LLYKNISRSIYVKDKIVFSFLILKRLKELDDNPEIKPVLFKFFLTGVLNIPSNYREKPKFKWVTRKMWLEILTISLLERTF